MAMAVRAPRAGTGTFRAPSRPASFVGTDDWSGGQIERTADVTYHRQPVGLSGIGGMQDLEAQPGNIGNHRDEPWPYQTAR